MTRFAPANTAAQKPRWSLAEVRAFQRELRVLREFLVYTNDDLARALDYSTKYVRMMAGELKCNRQPSEEFIRRYNELVANAPQPKTAFVAAFTHQHTATTLPIVCMLAAIGKCPIVARMRKQKRK